MFDAMELSKAIRAKKKKLAESDPELIGTSPVPDMNAQDIYDLDKKAYIEDMVKSDPKIDARETSMNEPGDDALQAADKARMGRLNSYLDGLDLSA